MLLKAMENKDFVLYFNKRTYAEFRDSGGQDKECIRCI